MGGAVSVVQAITCVQGLHGAPCKDCLSYREYRALMGGGNLVENSSLLACPASLNQLQQALFDTQQLQPALSCMCAHPVPTLSCSSASRLCLLLGVAMRSLLSFC